MRHTRTWMRSMPPLAGPDSERRTFELQLYDRIVLQPADLFEAEAKLLDGLAHRINCILDWELTGQTSVRHDAGAFNCYVGTTPADKVLIVMPRTTNALDWTPAECRQWCREVANKWLEVSGYAPLAGNDLPRPIGTNERVADSTLSTGSPDGQA